MEKQAQMRWEMFKEDYRLLNMLVESHISSKEKHSKIFQKESILIPSEYLWEFVQE